MAQGKVKGSKKDKAAHGKRQNGKRDSIQNFVIAPKRGKIDSYSKRKNEDIRKVSLIRSI